MRKSSQFLLLLCTLFLFSCGHHNQQGPDTKPDSAFVKGQFGYDLQFLKKRDSGLVVLTNGDAQVIVSPKYQAKVFTSTTGGDRGPSFGWINYKVFDKTPDAHMNAYGGENRIWLGPEGGKYSLFFSPDSTMVFSNWKTPSPFDTESWNLVSRDSTHVVMFKEMKLVNYARTTMHMRIDRIIQILSRQEIFKRTGILVTDPVEVVGYSTENILENTGVQEWTVTTGMPCIWILDMFKPSPETVIIVPFLHSPGQNFNHTATTNYFGEIPADRLKHNDSLLFFRADGLSRGKLGIVPNSALQVAGSYDGENKVLTIIQYDLERSARYLNQEWNLKKPAFSGDAVNAYNDGLLADGTQMGPFYEIESVSPAAFLKPNQKLAHHHAVFHFSGSEKDLSKIALKLLGVSLIDLEKKFQVR